MKVIKVILVLIFFSGCLFFVKKFKNTPLDTVILIRNMKIVNGLTVQEGVTYSAQKILLITDQGEFYYDPVDNLRDTIYNFKIDSVYFINHVNRNIKHVYRKK
jgi:hypothetical protein